jgi:hypothetical protein
MTKNLPSDMTPDNAPCGLCCGSCGELAEAVPTDCGVLPNYPRYEWRSRCCNAELIEAPEGQAHE